MIFTLIEVVQITGVDQRTLVEFVERQWVSPGGAPGGANWDEEDVARIRLIRELKNNLGANDEAIPLILHLVDQLYCLRNKVRRLSRH